MTRAQRLSALLVSVGLVALGACSEPAPTSSAGSASATLTVHGMTVEVPAQWPPSPDEQTRRLEAASRRRDPAAEVEVATRSAPGDTRAPSVTLTWIRQSQEYTSGSSVRDTAREMQLAVGEMAAARGIEAGVEVTCESHHCDGVMHIGPTETRLRMWRHEGRLETVSCGCAGAGCSQLATCSFPAPPAGAEAVDQR